MTSPHCLIVNTTTSTPVLIDHDVEQDFDLILFNYTAEPEHLLQQHWSEQGFRVSRIISKKTECKGQIFHALASESFDYDFISLWDHDLQSSVSVINELFRLGCVNEWHWYQPALTPDSFNSFLWTMDYSYPEYWRKGIDCIYTYAPFVEQMSPFFSGQLWEHLRPVFQHYHYASGYGLDIYWIPEALTVFDQLTFPVVIKSVPITHTKAIESAGVRFSNGLTAGEEMELCDKERYQLVRTLYEPEEWIDVQCISLDVPECQERRIQFSRSADKYDLEFDFFDAVDHRLTKRSDYPEWVAHKGRRVDWHEPLKPGEVGVAASHKSLYEQAFSEGVSALVVFEDDAVLTKSLDEDLALVEDADFLMLNNRWRHNRRGEVVGNGCGFEGYIITRRGIYKMLQILEHMDMPIDLIAIAHCRSMAEDRHGLTTVRNPLNPTLAIYHHHNYCVEHDQGISTIKYTCSEP